jgi:hypothetical protein
MLHRSQGSKRSTLKWGFNLYLRPWSDSNRFDIYDISRAVEDGATVPIYYESRLARIELDEAEKPKIDAEVEDLTEEEAASEQERLQRPHDGAGDRRTNPTCQGHPGGPRARRGDWSHGRGNRVLRRARRERERPASHGRTRAKGHRPRIGS